MTIFPSPSLERLAVRAAVRRLDAVRPGWRAAVDRDRLCMTDGYRCVLGQVFGDYVAGLVALGLTTSFLSANGHLADSAFRCDFPVEPWLVELDRDPAVAEAVPA